MKKTIKIGKTELTLDNNAAWMMIYRNQFGRDIVPALVPLAASALDILAGVLKEAGFKEGDEIDMKKLFMQIDGDTLFDAMAHVSAFELTDVINVTWALAAAADEDIEPPEKWIRQFDAFPLDVIVPDLVKLIGRGIVSSKNLRRLKNMGKGLQPIKSN